MKYVARRNTSKDKRRLVLKIQEEEEARKLEGALAIVS